LHRNRKDAGNGGTAHFIVMSVMTTYFQLKSDIKDIRSTQETQARVNELRLKILEGQVAVLQQEVNKLKEHNKS
jgi:hypothetical protein